MQDETSMKELTSRKASAFVFFIVGYFFPAINCSIQAWRPVGRVCDDSSLAGQAATIVLK